MNHNNNNNKRIKLDTSCSISSSSYNNNNNSGSSSSSNHSNNDNYNSNNINQNDNMNNNNNNNNNNGQFEVIFWKVFNNIYLFNLIINNIQVISNEMKLNNRMIKIYKFKDIKSTTWMLRKNQFSLLKCKLSNKEEIRISEYAVENLIYYLLYGHFDERVQNKRKYDLLGDESDNYDSGVDDLFKTCTLGRKQVNVNSIDDQNQFIEPVKELILLLFKNYNEIITKMDIMVFIIKHGLNGKEDEALRLIKLFIGQPYSLELTPRLFKYVIINYNVQFIKEFIQIANDSKFNIVDQDFRDQSLSIILDSKQGSVNQDVLEFILDNPDYYNQNYNSKFNIYIPYIYSRRTCSLKNCSPYRHINNISSNGKFNDKVVTFDINERDMKSFFGLKKELQIKLLQLKYYNTFHAGKIEDEIVQLFSQASEVYLDPSFKELYYNQAIKLKKDSESINQFIYDNNNKDQDESTKINNIYQFFSPTSNQYHIKSLGLYIIEQDEGIIIKQDQIQHLLNQPQS